MSGPMRAVIVLLVWTLSAVLLNWGRLPLPWRRRLSFAFSGAGLAFLFLALNTGGLRESASTGAFLIGTRYVTGTVSASASLPYYVMTGLCLLLGTTGLALPESSVAHWRKHWLLIAIVLSLATSALRLVLELAAAPPAWTWAAGVTQLAPLVGAFFALSVHAERGSWKRIAGSLLAYGLAARGGIAVLYVLATSLHLGSHYDLSAAEIAVRNPLTGVTHHYAAGSFAQLVNLAIVPQLVFWPVYTVIAGLLGAAVALLALRAFVRRAETRTPVPALRS
ncbi:MAG: hypothetical protein ABW221_13255 [Vicinamibacteria bacterium]